MMTIDQPTDTSIISDLAATLGSAKTARAWLAEANQNTANQLAAQQALAAVSVALEAKLPGATVPGDYGKIERAIARGNWQLAFDSAMQLPLGDSAALARLLLVADGLHVGGAAQQALTLLERAVEPYFGTPALYQMLIEVLGTLGRTDDAAIAQTLANEFSATAELVTA